MRIVNLEWVNMHIYNFFVSGPRFTNFLFNPWGTVVDNAIYHLSIPQSITEIFAVKVKVVFNRTKFWKFLAFPNFKGAVPLKIYTRVITPT